VAGNVGVFAVFAVVEELADRDALDQFGNSAHMIDMEVGYEDVIDPGDSGVGHGGLDARDIAVRVILWAHCAPTGIDEQGRVGFCIDDQSRLAAFHVNGVDEQVVGRSGLGLSGTSGCERGEAEQKCCELGKAAERQRAGIGRGFHVRRSVHGLAAVVKGRLSDWLG